MYISCCLVINGQDHGGNLIIYIYDKILRREVAAWTDLAVDLNFGQLTYQGDHSGFFS